MGFAGIRFRVPLSSLSLLRRTRPPQQTLRLGAIFFVYLLDQAIFTAITAANSTVLLWDYMVKQM